MTLVPMSPDHQERFARRLLARGIVPTNGARFGEGGIMYSTRDLGVTVARILNAPDVASPAPAAPVVPIVPVTPLPPAAVVPALERAWDADILASLESDEECELRKQVLRDLTAPMVVR